MVKNTVNELKLVHQFLQSFNNYDEPDSLSKDALSSNFKNLLFKNTKYTFKIYIPM